ncbi:acetyl-CoA acetyltransferase [Rhodococcus sp. T2V]|uniref:thiolase C-terminal domain-containing protein n=1 Tax=Rhodococcus sp. T2V TaxID=3034164 RepID=UPI0023E1167D|nr:acetyl-CoA acetyltransferase [Rhodococcus sp. T2V]MDF3308223.1 acetyl-CoA acetyltransferase [Rhodococcus sp. T2V]
MATQAFTGAAAVTGIGLTDISRDSGVSPLHLALTASRAAIADASLTASDIDGVLCYHMNDSAPVTEVAERLHLPPAIWTNEIYGGGTQSASILGDASMLIHSGTASNVLIYRALNGRSGKRMSQAPLRLAGGEAQFTRPYGMAGPVNLFALSSARWMHDTAATEDDLAAVVCQSRHLAASNPRALLNRGMTTDDYFASPWISTPLRRADCCQETDAGAALIVSRTDIADAIRPGSPRITTVVRGGGPGASSMDKAEDVATLFSRYLAGKLWDTSGLTPGDVDLALLYDAYSPVVLQQLEDFGFCNRGESGHFVRSGSTLPTGTLPVNPHGGLLSEGYVHGLNNILEAVRQLRGTATSHQVASPHVALCTGFGGSYGSAAILERP